MLKVGCLHKKTLAAFEYHLSTFNF